MRKDKEIAICLRKEGRSYREINKLLNIPTRTLFHWFRNTELPLKTREKIKADARKIWAENIINYNKKRALIALENAREAQQTRAKEIGKLTNKELLLVGTTLYWAEGNKKDRWGARFCNSDPAAIEVMMEFFRKICKVNEDKFRAQIQIHPNISEEEAKAYWSKITGIPINQFIKTQTAISKSSKFKRPANRLPYGTLHIKISDVSLVNRLKGWILGISQQYRKANVVSPEELETLETMADRKLMQTLVRTEEDIKARRIFSHKEVFDNINT